MRTPVPPADGVRRRAGRTRTPARPGAFTVALIAPLVAVVAAVVAAVAFASPALAQDANSVNEIIPADGSEVDVSPTEIVVSFNQEIGRDEVVTVDLSCGGQPQSVGLPEIGDDNLAITTQIVQPLPATTCLIAYSLRDADGGTIVIGTSSFRVLTDPPTTTTPATGTAATPTTDPFIRQAAVPAAAADTSDSDPGSTGGAVWFGRLVSTLGVLVLFGGLALIGVGWPEGPDYLVTARFFRIVWSLALLGAVVYLAGLAADANGTGFGAGLSPGAWLDLTNAGWEARGALLRFVTLLACAYVVVAPERVTIPETAMFAWGIPLAAVAATALTRVDGPVAALGYLVNIVHLLAAAVWIGGAALVSRVVLAGPGDEDLVQATRTFSKVSVPAIVAVSATGLVQMWRLDGGNLFGSNHGRVLLLKVIAVAVMVAVALAVRQQVTMRLDRAAELTYSQADRFKRAFGAEATVGVVVLAFSGWMVSLTPPKVDPLANEVYLEAMQFDDPTTGLAATVRVGPGVAGPSGLRVDVNSPESGITSLVLRFVPPQGSGSFIVEQPIPLGGAGTAFLDDSIGLPLDSPGVWTLELSASTATGVLDGARYTFELRRPDGSQVVVTAPAVTSDVNVSFVDQSTTTAPFATAVTTTVVATTTTTVP